jgi:hypothetical protein
MTAEYTAAQAQVAGEISTYGLLKTRLMLLAAGKPAQKDTPAQIAADADTYQTAVTSAQYQVMVNANLPRTTGNPVDGIYDQLVKECIPKVSVTVQQSIVPDTRRTYALKANTNVLYTDGLTFGVDANGFLTNGAPISSSQVTAIASAIANDIGLAAVPGAPLPAVQAQFAFHFKAAPPPSCAGGFVSTLAEQLADLKKCDLNKPADLPNAASLAEQILQDLPPPGSLPNLPSAALPQTFFVSLEDFGADGEPMPASRFGGQLAALKAYFGLDVQMKCSPRGPRPDSPAPDDGVPENAPKSVNGAYDGIVVSGPRACQFRAIQSRSAEQAGAFANVVVTQSYFWAEDSRYLTILPTTRGFMVARNVAYTFAGGQPTGVSDSRPSEALAVVSFPGAVVGSFFSGLTSAVTNRQAFTNGKTTDLTTQTNYLTAQTNYLAAQAALQKAKVPPATGP